MSLKALKNICYFAATFTLVVISVGAWVRLTDAGLGCPDWPGCYGILSTPDTEQELLRAKELYPDSTIDIGKAWREMFHRYLAGTLGILVFLITYLTLKYAKHVPKIYPISLSILIVVQSTMGMLTVTQLVKPTIVTTHLILGMTTAGLLLWNGLQVQIKDKINSIDFRLVNLIFICTLALIFQIILGGWTSTNYASLACTDFPKCLNQWWPSNMNYSEAFKVFNLPNINYEKAPLVYEAKLAIHFTHRIGALILTGLYALLFIYLFYIQKNKTIRNIGFMVFAVFTIQILLGISNVLMSLPISVAVLHTVNASVLLLTMITLLFYSTYHTKE